MRDDVDTYVVRAAAELPEEFQGPVAYDDRWWLFALAGLALVAGYYLLVLLLTGRKDRGSDPGQSRDGLASARRGHLDRIDRIEAAVRAGDLAARAGHQQLSETVRSYVAAVTSLPAPAMALADLQRLTRAGREPLVEAISLMYPPEFAPDDGRAGELFGDAVARARRLVTSWS